MTISVALCTYNGENFLRAQLESIFAQTLPVNEVIICDDISVDGTCNIIKIFQELFPNKITLIINESRLGSKKNFEKAINLTNQDIIFLCDQDDIWPINKVVSIINAFKENPDIEGIFTNGILIDENGIPTGNRLWDSFLYSPYIQSELNKNNLFEIILRYLPLITGATMAIKKEVKNIIIPFNETQNYWHDEWIGYKLAAQKILLPFNEPLLNYRIHEKQQVGVHDNCDGKLWKRYEGYFKKDIKLEDSKNYIFFLYERLKSARIICMIIKDQNILLVQLEKEFLLEKKRILKNFFYPYRKLILIKWFWEERFETTFKDFIFI